MTRTTNARIAGFTFLFYIAVGIAGMSVFGSATGGEDVAGRLAAIARNATAVRVVVLLALLQAFCAIALGVTLHAITREHDRDIAMAALVCRVVEGITAIFVPRTLGLLWLATGGASAAAAAHETNALAAFLLKMGAWNPGAIFFAVGSTLFAWLFVRGRLVPLPLAWLGVLASLLLVAILPLDLTGLVAAPFAVWVPMLVFEVTLAVWLLVKGVAPAAHNQADAAR